MYSHFEQRFQQISQEYSIPTNEEFVQVDIEDIIPIVEESTLEEMLRKMTKINHKVHQDLEVR